MLSDPLSFPVSGSRSSKGKVKKTPAQLNALGGTKDAGEMSGSLFTASQPYVMLMLLPAVDEISGSVAAVEHEDSAGAIFEWRSGIAALSGTHCRRSQGMLQVEVWI